MGVRRKAVLIGAALVALALAGSPLAAGAATPEPTATPSPSDAKAGLTNTSPDPATDAMFPPYQTQFAVLNEPLADLVNTFPDIVGKSAWDEVSRTATMDYYTGAEPAEESAFLAATRRIVVPPPLNLVWRPVGWSLSARGSLLQKITGNPDAWTSFFGSAPESGYIDESGNVHVSLADPSKVQSAPARSGVLPDGSAFVADPPSKVDWQVGRTSDFSPWSSGDRITAGIYECTSGFNWKKWGTGEYMGMTADHCAVAGGLTWKTAGVSWGTGVQSDPVKDAILMRAASGSSFNTATAYVGGATTSDLRRVYTFRATPMFNDIVALSGATGGLGNGKIIKTDFSASGVFPIVLVNYTGCMSGDSGGPWLTTQAGTGYVEAWGQHEGKFLYQGAYYCGFMPLNPISTALQASILINP